MIKHRQAVWTLDSQNLVVVPKQHEIKEMDVEEEPIDTDMINDAKFSCDLYIIDEQADADVSSSYTTTQMCGLFHEAIKISNSDYGHPCLEKLLKSSESMWSVVAYRYYSRCVYLSSLRDCHRYVFSHKIRLDPTNKIKK